MRRVTAQEAAATPPATVNTAGQAPTFLASGCEPANAATYATVSPAAARGPAWRFHSYAASAPAAASAPPPSGRFFVHLATAYPPTSPLAATAAAGTFAMCRRLVFMSSGPALERFGHVYGLSQSYEGGLMSIRTGCRAAVMSAVVAAFLVSCSVSSGGGPGSDVPEISAAKAAKAAESAESAEAKGSEPTAEPDDGSLESLSPGPVTVADRFSELQATLGETCTPGAGDCAYFLGRVATELRELEAAMRADAKGPGHFKEPLVWTGALWKTLGGDDSTANLEKHRDELVGTRDRINTWMQGHPDDYR